MSAEFFDYRMLEMYREISDESGDAVREIILSYLEDAPLRVLRIQQAIAQQNASELNEEAHALKSSSGNLGAFKLQDLCHTLEAMGRDGTTAQALPAFEALQTSFSQVKALLEDELAAL